MSAHIKKQHANTKMEKSEVTVPDSTSNNITCPKPDVEPPKPTCPLPGPSDVSNCMPGTYTVYTSRSDNDEVIFVSQNDNPSESSS